MFDLRREKKKDLEDGQARTREREKTIFDLTPFYTRERKGEDMLIFCATPNEMQTFHALVDVRRHSAGSDSITSSDLL